MKNHIISCFLLRCDHMTACCGVFMWLVAQSLFQSCPLLFLLCFDQFKKNKSLCLPKEIATRKPGWGGGSKAKWLHPFISEHIKGRNYIECNVIQTRGDAARYLRTRDTPTSRTRPHSKRAGGETCCLTSSALQPIGWSVCRRQPSSLWAPPTRLTPTCSHWSTNRFSRSAGPQSAASNSRRWRGGVTGSQMVTSL